jgi:predicted anti-sigma-YlaC factor YlaD
VESRVDARCERAREAFSARLDGEASALELVRARAHAARCPGCRRFAAVVPGLARALRAIAGGGGRV